MPRAGIRLERAMATLKDSVFTHWQQYDAARSAVLIVRDVAARQRTADRLDAAGVRLAAASDFASAGAFLNGQAVMDMILLDASGVADDVLAEVAGDVADAAQERMIPVIVSIGRAQMDCVAHALLGGDVQILCDASEGEHLAAIMQAREPQVARLNDATRDADAARLRRVNEEMVRIADTLLRLSRDLGDEGGGTTRQPLRDDPMPANGVSDGKDVPEVTARDVRAVIRARRMRDQFFTGELFADPAWDMLLDLFASELEGRRVSVSSLCIAAAVPPTTALRWIGAMHDAGLFERQADPNDRRRAYIGLSEKGRTAMHAYAATISRQGLWKF